MLYVDGREHGLEKRIGWMGLCTAGSVQTKAERRSEGVAHSTLARPVPPLTVSVPTTVLN